VKLERKPIEWWTYGATIPGSALVAALLILTGPETGMGLSLILMVVVGFGLIDLTGELFARLVGWESAE